MKEIEELLTVMKGSLEQDSFVKLTFSKARRSEEELKNVYVRRILIKDKPQLSFTYRYKTNDQVKNHDYDDAIALIEKLIPDSFQIATLLTLEQDLTLKISKKGRPNLLRANGTYKRVPDYTHDKQKQKRTGAGDSYLNALGISDKEGNIIPKMADKYRQINKYLEIIEGLLKTAHLPEEISVVDMGSGKGYLTFALYDFLNNKLGLSARVIGVDIRKDLVDYCNEVAAACDFDNLFFDCKSIEEMEVGQVDILIALHACDTATDDAISKGLLSDASLIICAPCCHKQVRQDAKGKKHQSPLLKYGIFQERQFEMVTDTIRALVMEKKQYQTKIFEFISNEHTRKNIMLVGSKTNIKVDSSDIQNKIDSLKSDFGIDEHYLEKIVQN